MKSLVCLSLVAPLALATACKVGDFSERTGNVESDADVVVPDASEGPVVDAMPGVDCEEEALPNGGGQHNPGLSCIVGGCHDGNTQDVPLWTMAGTAYVDIQGTAPLVGGTIVVTDANDQELKLITARNGNFYTAQPIAYPVQVKGSLCPNTIEMVSPVEANGASCNLGGCHDAAGNRIYVTVE